MPKKNLRVEIVRCVWFGHHFSEKNLTTRRGHDIEIFSPGWWNVSEGPMFIRAEMSCQSEDLFANEPVSVECYTRMSDVPDVPEEDVVVVFWDGQPDRKLDRPIICLSDHCEDDVSELIGEMK